MIYWGRGDYTNAALSAAAMVPLAGMAATGGKLAKRFVTGFQKHHLIPRAVYRDFEKVLSSINFSLDAGANLKKLPAPFHGNHLAYSDRVRDGDEINELIKEDGNLNLPSIENLQN
ncbi:AHH domain-containing protein [Sphingobacterium siyangense]|uniref:AHH domain-containing protein n=1 Tax=Sphingobacterium siyangense TaxID=459529 RepID=UPI001962BD1C|nr:AHH domain-containing protein [Sphingobacterium siyangense]QRY57033.1 AHH domain-containing protein [Sphingobacterium siyangense]